MTHLRRKPFRTLTFLSVLATLFLAGHPSRAAEDLRVPATVSVEPLTLTLDTDDGYDLLRLVVAGPDGAREEVSGLGERVYLDLHDGLGTPLPDGRYRYELWGTDAESGTELLVTSGTFAVAEGVFLDPTAVPEATDAYAIESDNLTVEGNACIGQDCSSDFTDFIGFPLVLRANNTRLRFQDTSDINAYAQRDWSLVANDNFYGGAEYFAIGDCEESGAGCQDSKAPFVLLAHAPYYSLFIDELGNVGLGTSIPGSRLDVDGDIAVNGLVDGRDLAADGTELDAHVASSDNPHQVTAAQVGAASASALDDHLSDYANPHDVGAAQVGAVATSDFAAHVADFTEHTNDRNNPHRVTAYQIGAADASDLSTHMADRGNPHGVTALQAGADPAGTAAALLADHEEDHPIGPSQLPVPVTEGGTGATTAAAARANLGIVDPQRGVAAVNAFSGRPLRAVVSLPTPLPPGTEYVVQVTVEGTSSSRLVTAGVSDVDEDGFNITLSTDRAYEVAAVHWTVHPMD